MTRNQLEIIERYLEKRMSDAEMADFENALLHDPLLKNEFELQRDIVESIKAYRKAEIKARLDRIQINPAPHFATFLKIAASVTVATFLTWGTFNFLSGDNEEITKVDLPAIAEHPGPQRFPEMPFAQNTDPITVPNDEPASPAATAKKAAPKKEIRIPEVRLPDVMDNFADTSPFIKDEGSLKANDDFPVNNDESLAPEIMVKKLSGRKNRFFYQNYEGKLYLYGDFSASPYELIELNIHNGRRLFLKHDSSYFAILPDRKEMTPLEIIQDTSLINELSTLKDGKK